MKLYVLGCLLVVCVCIGSSVGADDSWARTPPMGWRSWNEYQGRVNEDIIKDTAKAMAAKRDAKTGEITQGGEISLKDLGYNDVGLDDNWQACGYGTQGTFHDKEGRPLVNQTLFPDMKGMVDYIHSLGLMAGFYLNNCICNEKDASIWPNDSHYIGDVKATVAFGFDSVKLDNCGAFKNLSMFYDLFNREKKGGVMIENCHWGVDVPVEGSSNVPYHMFRCSDDIESNWKSMFKNLQTTRKFQGDHPLSRPGQWAYPDMLQVGRMANFEQDRAHFGAWAVTSSPLILGHAVVSEELTMKIWPLIANTRAIHINQQWAGHPGKMVHETAGKGGNMIQVWAKPLEKNEIAVFVINDNPASAVMELEGSGISGISFSGEPSVLADDMEDVISVPLVLVGALPSNTYEIKDVWTGAQVSSRSGPNLVFKVRGQDSAFVTLTPH